MNVLLIIVIIILFVMAVVGMHRGFIKCVYPFAAMILTIVLLALLAPQTRNLLISRTGLDDRIDSKIYTALEPELKPGTPLSEQVRDLPLPKSLRESLAESLDEKAGATLDSALRTVSQRLTRAVITAIVYVGGFILLYILLLLIGHALKLAAKLPVLKQADRLLGLILGILMGLLLLDIFFLLLTAFAHTAFGLKMMRMIAESPILSFFYDINLLTRLF